MNRVYLGRLPNRAQDRDIDRFFKGFGKITDIMLKSGFAFIEFENKRDADDAVQELNGQVLCGERVIVEHAKGTPRGEDFRRDLQKGYPIPSSRYSNDRRGSPPPGRTYRLIVKNLSSKVSWQDLKDVMRKAGEVIYADAHKERKNEGVVEYMSHREVRKAIDRLDGMELCGRKIELVEDSSNNRGDGDRKRSRSRSGSSKRRRSGHRKRRGTSDSRSRSRSHDRRRKARDDSASPPRRNRNKSDSASPVADKRKRTERKRSGSSEKRSRSRSVKKSRSSMKKSRSPSKKRSRSPSKEKSSEKKNRSPSEKKSRSPSEKKSRSPSEKKSRSPSEKRSRSRSVGRKSKGESSGEESEGEKK